MKIYNDTANGKNRPQTVLFSKKPLTSGRRLGIIKLCDEAVRPRRTVVFCEYLPNGGDRFCHGSGLIGRWDRCPPTP